MNEMLNVLREVRKERTRQQEKWGEQNHPNGTGGYERVREMLVAKQNENLAFNTGNGTWLHILHEEVAEAFAEESPERLRQELIQVAAVAVAWVEAIDRAEVRHGAA